jgi:hypothetical protein
MKSTRKEILLEVSKSRNLVVRPYFPLTLCFFDGFLIEFGNARFRGNNTERNSVFGFIVNVTVLGPYWDHSFLTSFSSICHCHSPRCASPFDVS